MMHRLLGVFALAGCLALIEPLAVRADSAATAPAAAALPQTPAEGAPTQAASSVPPLPAFEGGGHGEGADAQEKPLQYALSYRFDARIGTRRGEPGFQVGGAEAEFQGSYGRQWEFAGQVPVLSQFSSRGWGMHFGNLYAVRKWRLGAPTLKFGQFVVPFSNLTTVDVHSRLIQTLYRYSLGERIDAGAETEGYLGPDSEWQLALTSGSGPYRFDSQAGPVVTARVSHKFEEHGNSIRLGLSGADGRLPVFSLTGDPVSEAGSPILGWANKRRLALDLEAEHGVDVFNLEGTAGTDGGRNARGLWLGWTRPLDEVNSVEAAVETWHQPESDGGLWGAWLGSEHRLDGARTVRTALRWCRSHEAGQDHSELSLLAQIVRQF